MGGGGGGAVRLCAHPVELLLCRGPSDEALVRVVVFTVGPVHLFHLGGLRKRG